jgi:hypothetical protein
LEKTIFAGTIARHNAAQGIPVLIIDTEMTKSDLQSRHLAAMSKINLTNIEHGKFKDSEDKVRAASADLSKYPVYYRNVVGKSFEELLSICRRWILTVVGSSGGRTNDCLIIYDYFKLTDSSQLNNMQEYQALGFQISKLHNFCIKYDVPAHTFVQTNRDDDVSQSDRLQWLASSVAVISEKTEAELAEDGLEYGNLKFASLKNRFGPGLEKWDRIFMQRRGEFARIDQLCTKGDMISRKRSEEDEQGTEF